jgi:hypothetical protein
MNADRFDALLRSLTATPSRRGVAHALAGIIVAGTLDPLFGLTDAAAKKKKKKRKKKPPVSLTPPITCTPNCFDRTCGNDGCDGSCGECGAGFLCQGGNCACPPGTKTCGASCVPTTACCPPCTGGQSCLSNGSCATPCVDGGCSGGDCLCAQANAEGFRHCVVRNTCDGPPCLSSAECAAGKQCLQCTEDPPNRCTQLCA